MASSQLLDVRSEAKDYARVKTQKTKWSRGARPLSGRQHLRHDYLAKDCHCEDCDARPIPGASRNYTTLKQAEKGREINRANTMAKKIFRNAVVEAVDGPVEYLSDSSADVDVIDTASAPELNEVMYSYDAPAGPSRGGDVLSYAITQAVQRYENNETEKIVKQEYDLVLDGKDEPVSHVADADEDYELI